MSFHHRYGWNLKSSLVIRLDVRMWNQDDCNRCLFLVHHLPGFPGPLEQPEHFLDIFLFCNGQTYPCLGCSLSRLRCSFSRFCKLLHVMDNRRLDTVLETFRVTSLLLRSYSLTKNALCRGVNCGIAIIKKGKKTTD